MKHDALRAFERLLVDRALPMGMIAASDRDRMWERHVLDSAAAASAFEDGDHDAVDLGSGAGLPGIPLAIELPHVRFVLAESRAKRVGFLELAVQELGLQNVEIHHGRVEELPAASFDVATARAFAPPLRAWRAAAPLLRGRGRLVYFAGGSAELDQLAGEGVSIRPVLDSARRLVIMAST